MAMTAADVLVETLMNHPCPRDHHGPGIEVCKSIGEIPTQADEGCYNDRGRSSEGNDSRTSHLTVCLKSSLLAE